MKQMKKNLVKSIMLLGAAAFAMSSCSSDSILEEANTSPGNLIGYSVNVPSATRGTNASGVYDAANFPESFEVWASHSDGTTLMSYFDRDEITKEGVNNNLYTGKGTYYWPATGKLNFYAIAGITSTNAGWSWNDNYQPTYTYENSAGDKDFLYATNLELERPIDVSSYYVRLNFKHALSQLNFKVSVANANLYVKVKSISVVNLYESGTFKFPGVSTEAGWEFNTTKTDYSLAFDDTEKVTSGNSVSPTGSKVLLVMPYHYTANDLSWKSSDDTATLVDGLAYFKINCQIYNTSADSTTEDGVCLWDGNKDIYVPATMNWTSGYKYTYNFIFGTGDGGYDGSDPTQPVLVPIQYEWSCTEWDTHDENITVTTENTSN